MLGVIPGDNLGTAFKKFAQYLLKAWDIKYDDIYQLIHLFRIPNTINSKSGRYKIPLSLDEILTLKMAEINDLSIGKRPPVELISPVQDPFLSMLYRRALDETHQARASVRDNQGEESGLPPRDAKLCYYELLKGVGEGYRDKSGIRLASYFRKLAYPQDMTEALMLAWNSRNTPPMKDVEITAKVNGAYEDGSRLDYGCNDEILQAYCQRGCKYRRKKDGTDGMVQLYEQVEADYELYAKETQKRLCVIDIPTLGPAIRGIAPGEVMTIIARQGIGKTALLINLLMRIGYGLDFWKHFFSMEQPSIQIWERMASIANAKAGKDIQKIFEGDDASLRSKMKIYTRRLFNHVTFCEKSSLDPEHMMQIVRHTEENVLGRKIGLVAVDYLGRMAGKGDSYERASDNARGLKDMAKELDCAVIALSQASRKAGGDGTTELDAESGRDSGQIEEASDMVVTMWRPDKKSKSADDNEIIRLKLDKNRKGPSPVTVDLRFIKKFLRFDSLDNGMWLNVEEGGEPFLRPQNEDICVNDEPLLEEEERSFFDDYDDRVWR